MAQDLLTNLYSLKLGVDVVLKLDDGREIGAHRCILMGASKYFHKMFTGDFQEKDSKELALKEMHYETLEMLLSFIYTGKLNFDKCSIRDAILAADYLIMDSAMKSLNEHVCSSITTENCIDVYCVIDKLSEDAQKKVMQFIRRNLEPLTPGIASLSLNQFLDILIVPKFCRLEEKIVLLAIKAWTLAAPEEREKHVFELLSTIVFYKKVEVPLIMDEILPICKCAKSRDFVMALLAKNRGYNGDFVKQFFDKNWFAEVGCDICPKTVSCPFCKKEFFPV